MARPKRQEERRGQLVEAARLVIAEHGLGGATLARIAQEAGLTPGAVLYYYPDVQDLVLEAIRLSMERFHEHRAQGLDALPDDPAVRLVWLVENGLPTDARDVDVRLFCQMGGAAGSNRLAAALLTTLYDRQVTLYQVVLEQGRARGEFDGANGANGTAGAGAATRSIARNLVALEDAYGYRIVAGHGSIDTDAAIELVLDYARCATGHALPRSAVARSAAEAAAR